MSEALVMLPDMMCDARVFGPQLAELSADLVMVTAPLTRGERIEEIASGLLDQLPRRFALFGMGLGGVVALEVLRRAPDRLTRLGLMCTSPLTDTPNQAVEREPQIVKARAGRLAEVMQEIAPDSALAPGPAQPEVAALLADMAQRLGPEVFVRQARALQRRRDQQATLRRCKVPALVMCGAHGSEDQIKRHRSMSDLLPYGGLEVIEGAGACPPLERPDQVTDSLRDWMNARPVLS